MGIVSVHELKGVRTGKIDSNWKRSYRRAWRVITDNPLTGALEVRLSIPVQLGYIYEIRNPVTGARLEFDNYAFALNIEAALDGSANDDCQWIVTVDYGAWDPTQFPENPLFAPIKITWGGSRFQRVCELTVPDSDGNAHPVINSAGDYFDPPIMIDDSRPTLQIVRNEPYFNPHLALSWKDTVNGYAFYGFPPNTVKLSMPTGDLQYNPVCGFYYVITYEFEINPDGWIKLILDQGMKVWDGTSPFPQPAKNTDGSDVTSPVLLNGSGGQLAIGSTPTYIAFQVYYMADFSLLGFNFPGAPGQGF